jgi:hypothetical protein
MADLAAHTAIQPALCTFDAPGRKIAHSSLKYKITVAPLHLGRGDRDTAFSVRFQTNDAEHATETMLVSYIPSVAPSLSVTRDGESVHIDYVFNGAFVDELTVTKTAGTTPQAAAVAVAFVKTSDDDTIFTLRCDPYALPVEKPLRAPAQDANGPSYVVGARSESSGSGLPSAY